MGCCCSELKPGEELLATEEFIIDMSVADTMEYIPLNCNWSGFFAFLKINDYVKDEWTGEWPDKDVHQLIHYKKYLLDRHWSTDIPNK